MHLRKAWSTRDLISKTNKQSKKKKNNNNKPNKATNRSSTRLQANLDKQLQEPLRDSPPRTALPREAAQSPKRSLFENGKPLFQIVLWCVSGGWGVETEFTMIFFFFLPPLTVYRKTSMLLFLLIRVALTCSIITLLSTYCARHFQLCYLSRLPRWSL